VLLTVYREREARHERIRKPEDPEAGMKSDGIVSFREEE